MSSFVNYRLTKCTYYQKLKLSIVGHGTRNMSMSLPPKWQWEGKSILQILILIDKKSRYSRFWCHLLYTRDLSQLSVTIWASGCDNWHGVGGGGMAIYDFYTLWSKNHLCIVSLWAQAAQPRSDSMHGRGGIATTIDLRFRPDREKIIM